MSHTLANLNPHTLWSLSNICQGMPICTCAQCRKPFISAGASRNEWSRTGPFVQQRKGNKLRTTHSVALQVVLKLQSLWIWAVFLHWANHQRRMMWLGRCKRWLDFHSWLKNMQSALWRVFPIQCHCRQDELPLAAVTYNLTEQVL